MKNTNIGLWVFVALVGGMAFPSQSKAIEYAEFVRCKVVSNTGNAVWEQFDLFVDLWGGATEAMVLLRSEVRISPFTEFDRLMLPATLDEADRNKKKDDDQPIKLSGKIKDSSSTYVIEMNPAGDDDISHGTGEFKQTGVNSTEVSRLECVVF